MQILTANQIRKWDAYTIENKPISSLNLMAHASSVFTDWYLKNLDYNDPVAIFCGVGNNGGDGLVVSKYLLTVGVKLKTFIVEFSKKHSEDFATNLKLLQQTQNSDIQFLTKKNYAFNLEKNTNVIDAIFGSGLNKPIHGFTSNIVQTLNNTSNTKIALDIPSGLSCDKHIDDVKFQADYTLSFEAPKLSFLLPENEKTVGNWTSRSIGLLPDFLEKIETKYSYFTNVEAKKIIKKT